MTAVLETTSIADDYVSDEPQIRVDVEWPLTRSASPVALRDSDPQAWLFSERARFLRTGICDPFAEQMLRRAGFLTGC